MKLYATLRSQFVDDIFTRHDSRLVLAGSSFVLANIGIRLSLSQVMGYVPSMAVAYMVSSLIALALSRRFVFAANSKGDWRGLLYFLVITIIGLTQTLVISRFLADALQQSRLPSPPSQLLAQVLALSTLAISRFLLPKCLPFSPRKDDQPALPASAAAGDNRPDMRTALALLCAWAGLVLAVNPVGNFPLNDDWSYGRTVKILLEQHRLFFGDWTTPILFLQALYGALFCLPFGFSFTALRLSTLVLAGAGIVGQYFLLRQLRLPRSWAVCGALIVMLNPVYVINSFSFMTDVPFTVLITFAALYFLRALQTGCRRAELVATLLLCGAGLIRQIALPVALAYGVARVISSGLNGRSLLRAAWPALAVVASLAAYNATISALGLTSALHDVKQREILIRVARFGWAQYASFIAGNIGTALTDLSAFALPLAALALPPVLRGGPALGRWPRATLFWLLFLWGILVVALDMNRWSFPVRGTNYDGSLTLGPIDLRNFHPGWDMPLRKLPSNIPVVLNSALALADVVLVYLLAMAALNAWKKRSALSRDRSAEAAFLALIWLAYLCSFSLFQMFDRYLLPALPFFLATVAVIGRGFVAGAVRPNGIARIEAGFAAACGLTVLLLTGTLAVGGSHDYMAWNRVRWAAVATLISHDKLAPAQIDGGFEVSGWNLYAQDPALRQRWNGWFAKEISFDLTDPDYFLAFDATDSAGSTCYQHKLKNYPFATWLPPHNVQISVYRFIKPGDRPAGCKLPPPPPALTEQAGDS